MTKYKDTAENTARGALPGIAGTYADTADRLEAYRAELMMKRSCTRSPKESESLTLRIDLLRAEINELRSTARQLMQLAAPRSASPSLSAKGTKAS